MNQNDVYAKFNIYRLSPRQKEIGYLWLQNYSAKDIALKLNIANSTVYTVIKEIYKKTEANGRGGFMIKFLS